MTADNEATATTPTPSNGIAFDHAEHLSPIADDLDYAVSHARGVALAMLGADLDAHHREALELLFDDHEERLLRLGKRVDDYRTALQDNGAWPKPAPTSCETFGGDLLDKLHEIEATRARGDAKIADLLERHGVDNPELIAALRRQGVAEAPTAEAVQ